MAFSGPRVRDLPGATLLIGSALSGDQLNGLPAGMQISEKIVDRMLGFAGMTRNEIWDWDWGTPFEQLLNDQQRWTFRCLLNASSAA